MLRIEKEKREKAENEVKRLKKLTKKAKKEPEVRYQTIVEEKKDNKISIFD